MLRRVVLTSAATVVVAAGLAPILVLIVQSVVAEFHTGFAYFRALLSSGRAWILAGHSLALSSVTTLITLVVGVPLGVLLGKSDLPLRRLLLVVFVIPLVIPPYVLAVCWSNALSQDGAVARWLTPGIASQFSAWLFGLGGCILVLTTTFLPIVMLITVIQLSSVRSSYEEAAKLVCGWPGVLWHVTLPLIAPGIALAAVLVFLLSLGEFGVPIFLRVDVLPVESFAQFTAFYNFEAATAAALPLGLVTFLLLLLERVFMRSHSYAPSRGHDAHTTDISLRSRTMPFLALIMTVALLVIVFPLGTLIGRGASVSALSAAISHGGPSLGRSMAYAAAGATGLLLIGFLCGYTVQTRALRLWRGLDFLTIFLFALPGPVIAIGLISLWNRKVTEFVYATPIIIILGYLAQYTALTTRMSVSALDHVPRAMEEAAQVSGAHWGRRLLGIVVPLVRKGLAAAWLVGYLFCLRDTGITMLVYPPGHDTLPVRTFTLMANGPPELIAALCLLMIAAAVVPLVILAATFRTTVRMA